MTTLFLLRHAKSSWDDPYLADYDRPLAPRGERAARGWPSTFVTNDTCPALVLCSPARRAADTFAMVRPSLGEDVDVRSRRTFTAPPPVMSCFRLRRSTTTFRR